MHSSYNLIKNNYANLKGDKEIMTDYSVVQRAEDDNESNVMHSYEIIGNKIIGKARNDAETITMEAIKKARDIERDSYTKGYEQGLNNGYEDGKNKGYEEARVESEAIIAEAVNRANNLLSSSEEVYNTYLTNKKNEIINLAFEMAKLITNKEFQKDESILNLVEPVIEECKGEENLIIKCNAKYIETLASKIEQWKKVYSISGEIFIFEDPLMDIGNAVVEKNKGKIEVGIDVTLNRLEDVLKEICGEENNA